MSTTIRLTRLGKKKRPFYRLVVLDSRKRRDGAYLANLGYYNPFVEPHQVELHADDIISWLQKGATMSGTARSLLRAEGILYRYSLVQQGMSAEEIAGKMDAWQSSAEARNSRRQQAAADRQRAERDAKIKAEEEKAAAAKAEAEAEEAKAAEAEAEAAAEAEAPAESEAGSSEESGEDKEG